MLHSNPGGSESFEGMMREFGAGRQVIAPDYLGNGCSDSPPSGAAVDIKYVAASMMSFVEALGVGPVDILGSHTGALVAIEYAIANPSVVGSLILDGPPLIDAELAEDIERNYFESLDPDPHGLQLLRAWNVRRDNFIFFPWYARRSASVRDLQMPTAAELHHLVLGFLQSGPTYHLTYRAAWAYPTQARLPLIARPALLCGGSEDALAEGLADTARLLVSSTYSEVQITEVTPWYPSSSPDAVARVVREYESFLDRAAAY
jgi:pimeloyl-ACP methyl ester carboxylesterase